MRINELKLNNRAFIDAREKDRETILGIYEANKITQLPVIEQKKVVGILDLFEFLKMQDTQIDVKKVMKTRIVVGKEKQQLSDFTLLSQMILPVVDDEGDYLTYITREELQYQLQCQHYKELKEEYDAIFDSSYDGIYITDGEGVILRANKACERIEGIILEEVMGKHVQELVDAGIYSDAVSLKVLEKRTPVTILAKAKNGKEHMLTGNPVIKDGEIVRVVINSRDITELNHIKRELLKTRELTEKYQTELELLRQEQTKLENIVVNSPAMRKIIDMTIHVAKVDSTVLIQGESGVGKEIIAKLIHRNSDRKKGPFIKINCGAIPESLMESEFFGYEKGAFTGASKTGKPGLVELANEGTLFLDEIGEMPLNLQVKLLRVIQDWEILRVGGKKTIPVNARIIAATNRDLSEMVREKKFREDLFYRLNVVPVFVPALRERKEDIEPLIGHFLNKFNSKYKLDKRISQEAIDCLIDYDWPGNVRELENLMERLIVTTSEDRIEVTHLPELIKERRHKGGFDLRNLKTYKETMDNYEKNLLLHVMNQSSSTQEMAELLGLDRSTIRRKLKKHKIKILF